MKTVRNRGGTLRIYFAVEKDGKQVKGLMVQKTMSKGWYYEPDIAVVKNTTRTQEHGDYGTILDQELHVQ